MTRLITWLRHLLCSHRWDKTTLHMELGVTYLEQTCSLCRWTRARGSLGRTRG